MNFRDFEAKIAHLPLFNLNKIRKFDPGFHRQQLTDWQKRGYIQPMVGSYYFVGDQAVDEGFLFMVANQVYSPSYVSLESALAYHQVIPESVLGVTSVSARKTHKFDSAWGQFSYRSIKPEYMFGYQVVNLRPAQKVLIASLEKAVLDYLYLNSHIKTIEDFDGLRWNKAPLQQLIHNPTFEQYLRIFAKQSLDFRVGALMRYLDA